MPPVDTVSSAFAAVITASINRTQRANVVAGRTQKPFRVKRCRGLQRAEETERKRERERERKGKKRSGTPR